VKYGGQVHWITAAYAAAILKFASLSWLRIMSPSTLHWWKYDPNISSSFTVKFYQYIGFQ
jgi:hypothetical protein